MASSGGTASGGSQPDGPSNRALLQQVVESRRHLTPTQFSIIRKETAKGRPLADILSWWGDKCREKAARAVAWAIGLGTAGILSTASVAVVPITTAGIDHSGQITMGQIQEPAGPIEGGEAGAFGLLTVGLGGFAWRRKRSGDQWEDAADAGRDAIYALAELHRRERKR